MNLPLKIPKMQLAYGYVVEVGDPDGGFRVKIRLHHYDEADDQDYAIWARVTTPIAGTDYGMGSSRDWAAKGTRLLGVDAVVTKSFERIHRSNLIGMGVLPLNFADPDDFERLGLDGTETYDVTGISDDLKPGQGATHPKKAYVKLTDGSIYRSAIQPNAKVRTTSTSNTAPNRMRK